MHWFLFVYAVNYGYKKENRNLQKSVLAGQTSQKFEIGIGQENCNRCICNIYIWSLWWLIRTKCKATMLKNGIAFVIAINYYACSRSSQINKTVRILSCKILWCWLSDAWAAVFLKWDQMVWIRPFLPQHEQRRASATSHCKLNWTVGKHHIVAHRLYNQWEIAVICFVPQW